MFLGKKGKTEQMRPRKHGGRQKLSFLGRFRIFENRTLDPVQTVRSKCEANLLSKSLKNCTNLAQLGSGSISNLKLKRSPFCSNTFEFFDSFSNFPHKIEPFTIFLYIKLGKNFTGILDYHEFAILGLINFPSIVVIP